MKRPKTLKMECPKCKSKNVEKIKISGYHVRLCCYDCGHIHRILGITHKEAKNE